MEPFNIGEAAARSGVSAKMVRHYESLGLLPGVARTDAGYRQYTENNVHTLRFIRRARDLGFSMAEIAELLRLWQNKGRASADVKRIALAHAADLHRRIEEMTAMKRTLERLADCCHGDGRPDCQENRAIPSPNWDFPRLGRKGSPRCRIPRQGA